MNAPLPPQPGSDQLLRLTRALAIYNQAFRSHIRTVLGKKLGPNWWQEGIVRRISSIQQDLEDGSLEIRTDNDALSLLEPKHYYWIVKEHREHFPKLWSKHSSQTARIRGRPTTLMHEVKDWRNVQAHPPAHLNPATVDRAVEAMVCLVSLFDQDARVELSKLSGKARNKAEPTRSRDDATLSEAKGKARDLVAAAEDRARALMNEAEREAADMRKAARAEAEALRARAAEPTRSRDDATLSEVKGKARDLVAAAEDRARALMNEAEREAADMRKAARAEAEALRARAKEETGGSRTSRPGNSVPREMRDKLDRARLRVRELENRKSKAKSEIETARRNIMVLARRADAIEAETNEKAEQILRAARDEAAAIRTKSQQAAAHESLRKSAMAAAERKAAALLDKAREEAAAIKAGARKNADSSLMQARQVAESIAAEAHARAQTVRKEAEQHARQVRDAADHDRHAAKEIVEKAQAEARQMVQNARNHAAGTPFAGRMTQPDGRTAWNQPRHQHRSGPDQPSRPELRDGFRPARSGNGFNRALHVDGWWLNCWVGRARGVFSATVFPPTRTIDGRRVAAQDGVLMERDCSSEDEAFAWLHDAQTSGQIGREALRAIRLFEQEEADEEPGFGSDAIEDDDIPF